MSSGLLQIIKQTALDAVDNAQMCDLRFGTVVDTSPLRVKVTNQFTLPSSLLIVPEHLTNHTVNVVIKDDDDDTNDNYEMRINNALKVGDRVALLRKQGGQSYFILDRI
jgi:hypothetical protein